MKKLSSLIYVALFLVFFSTQLFAGGGGIGLGWGADVSPQLPEPVVVTPESVAGVGGKTINNHIGQDVQLGTVSEKRECPPGASCDENYILRGGAAVQVLAPIVVTPEVTAEKKTKSKK